MEHHIWPHITHSRHFSLISKAMEGSMLTISLGIWMELPGVNYRDLTLGKRRYVLLVTIAHIMKTEISKD